MPPSRPMLVVAWREITERIGSRAFAVSTLVIVAVVVAAVMVPGLRNEMPTMRVGVAGDAPPALSGALREAATADGSRLVLRRYPTLSEGEAGLRDGTSAVLIAGRRRLVWKAEPDARLSAVVRAALHRVRFAQQAAMLGLSPAQAVALARPPAVPERRLEAGDRDAREAIAMASFLVLLTMVLWYGASVADGVAQEKGTRVMELLLCRVRPRDLLAGKVLGIGAVGLAQMLLALVAALVAIVATNRVEIPDAVPATLVAAVVWFTLGYAFFSVAFAAVGALASRVEDLGAALAPLTWLVMLSAFAAPLVAEYPDAWYVRLTSLFPTSAPFVMPVRIAIDEVPWWETIAAMAILFATAIWLVRAGAAVYAGSVLRTGGRPRFREVWEASRPCDRDAEQRIP